VLVAILVDHIPGNVLETLTPRNFGLSDSSEAFVFLSGLSVGAVYLPRARKHGLTVVARSCFLRAFRLYGVHVGLSLAALFIFACAWALSGVDDLIAAHGRSFVFETPARGLAGLALLSHQLGYFNILPLYVVLMFWAPLALSVAMRSPPLALLASAGVYAVSRAFDLDLPNWPEAGGWFFNPFTWQLVFTIGLVSAIVWQKGAPRAAPLPVVLSVGAIATAALVTTSAAGLAPGFRDAASAHLDLAKQDLGLARLVHFAALAYLAAVWPAFARLVDGAAGRAVQSLGRHGLAVFAAGSLLSAAGQAVLGAFAPHVSVRVEHLVGLAYTLAGIAALFALTRWIECRNSPVLPALGSAASQPL